MYIYLFIGKKNVESNFFLSFFFFRNRSDATNKYNYLRYMLNLKFVFTCYFIRYEI